MPGALIEAMPWGRELCALARSVQLLHIRQTKSPSRGRAGLPWCAIFVSQMDIPDVIAPPGFRNIISYVPQSFGKALTGITALGSGVNLTRRHRLFNSLTRLGQLTEGHAYWHCSTKQWVRHRGFGRLSGSLSARASEGRRPC